ncbi:hypothetical protein CMUS01_05827 [Colletotrichum musicola]|uniref:Uncharacterized protein n=1 Tax=Colletotrichum musicola TaxID=2175873 RepID=A0A8H6KR10_9PEZI|nr:hypothetical protein CMUS01_05827 [Colletotrichum musicola]
MHPTPQRARPSSQTVSLEGGFSQKPEGVQVSPLSQYAPSSQQTLPLGMQKPWQEVLSAAQPPAGGPSHVAPVGQHPPGTQRIPEVQKPPVPVAQHVPEEGMHFPSQGCWVLLQGAGGLSREVVRAKRAEEWTPGRRFVLGVVERAPLRGVLEAVMRGRRRTTIDRKGVERCIVRCWSRAVVVRLESWRCSCEGGEEARVVGKVGYK